MSECVAGKEGDRELINLDLLGIGSGRKVRLFSNGWPAAAPRGGGRPTRFCCSEVQEDDEKEDPEEQLGAEEATRVQVTSRPKDKQRQGPGACKSSLFCLKLCECSEAAPTAHT